MRPENVAQGTSLFAEQEIQVTVGGNRHLKAAIGSIAFRKEFVVRKHVDEWISEVRCLSKIA